MNLKEFVENNDNRKPFVIKQCKAVKYWGLHGCTLKKVSNLMKSSKLKFRVGMKNYTKGVQWEHECKFVDATVGQYIEWINNNCSDENPLREYEYNNYWVYADYKYLQWLIKDIPGTSLEQLVDWTSLGYSGEEGFDSTIWVGSKGAHTQCHQDSYCYNVVYQVSGCKRWVIFEPQDGAKHLKPTRIPYEESTVWSKIDFININPQQLIETEPYVVTLNAGDILYVPNKYWHFVENCSDNSISVNSWFPHKTDDFSRIAESISKLLISSLKLSLLSNKESSIDESISTSLDLVKEATNKLTSKSVKHKAEAKLIKLKNVSYIMQYSFTDALPLIRPEKKSELTDKMKKIDHKKAKVDDSEDFERKFIDALISQEVVEIIAEKILNEI